MVKKVIKVFSTVFLAGVFVGIVISIKFLGVDTKPQPIPYYDTIPIYDTITKVNWITKHTVLSTKYNAVVEQCNSNPLITADNSHIDLTKLNNYDLHWIAISRDLKEYYKFGDTVIIECSSNSKIEGEWVIHDVMNKRFTNRIDFLMPLNDTLDFNKPTYVTMYKK